MTDKHNPWDTPDGLKAIKVLEDAGLLTWEERTEHYAHHYRLRFGTVRHRCVGSNGEYLLNDIQCGSSHVAYCILRDAARVFIATAGCYQERVSQAGTTIELYDGNVYVFLAHGSDTDAALIAGVLAVGKEKP